LIEKWDIVGHDKQIRTLEEDVTMGNVSHAYLFTGPAHSGKCRTARAFAARLQCPQNKCGGCKVCREIRTGTHPDTLLMKDNGSSISIDDVRDLTRLTSLTAQGRYRLVIIENVERMPIEAQNAFLKTLEEPAGRTVFLLTATQVDKVLLTLRSRARQISFSMTPDDVLMGYLKEKFGSSPQQYEVVSIAQGRPGLAIAMMKYPEVFDHQKALYYRLDAFLKKNDLVGKFRFIEELEKDPVQVRSFLDAMTRFLRKVMLDYLTVPDPTIKSRFTLEELTALIDSLEKTGYLIKGNINRRLALECLLMRTEK
jgi:DNA polymerase-3 subunit delta'